jgi:hypothetical protein
MFEFAALLTFLRFFLAFSCLGFVDCPSHSVFNAQSCLSSSHMDYFSQPANKSLLVFDIKSCEEATYL